MNPRSWKLAHGIYQKSTALLEKVLEKKAPSNLTTEAEVPVPSRAERSLSNRKWAGERSHCKHEEKLIYTESTSQGEQLQFHPLYSTSKGAPL